MTTLTLTQKIDGLRQAQNELRHQGWCKYDTQDNLGRICAYNALWRAGMTGDEALEDVVADMPRPTQPYMDAIGRICGFNNLEADTVEDVIAQFQITIDRLTRKRSMERHPTAREMVNA